MHFSDRIFKATKTEYSRNPYPAATPPPLICVNLALAPKRAVCAPAGPRFEGAVAAFRDPTNPASHGLLKGL